MIKGKHGLEESTIEKMTSVFSKFPQITKIILYGSRAKGNFKPGSDIDLVLVAPAMTTTDLLRMERDLEDLMLPYKIDLSLHHQIESQDLLDHIARVGNEFGRPR